LSGLGRAASVVLLIYAGLRLGDLAVRGLLGTAFDGSWQAWLFLFELSLSALIPATLLSFRRVRTSAAGLATCAGMTVLGMIGYRFDVCIEAFWRPQGMPYFPSWTELAVSFGIVAGAMLVFIFFVEKLKVYPQEHADELNSSPRGLEKGDYGPTTIGSLLPDSLRGPRRYSLAAVAAAAATLALLPADLFSRPQLPKTPVFATRTLDGQMQARDDGHGHEICPAGLEEVALADTRRVPLVMIDGNRDGRLVLFPHDYHVEKLIEIENIKEQDSCATCHHLNMPFDKNTSCCECHRDMYTVTDIFDHASHVAKLGGNNSCEGCHDQESTETAEAEAEGRGSAWRHRFIKWATSPTKSKSLDIASGCAKCHEDMIVTDSLVDPPEEGAKELVAGGYMNAMHELCISCHEQKLEEDPELYDPHFADCATCHRDIDGTRFRQMKPYVINQSIGKTTAEAGSVISQ